MKMTVRMVFSVIPRFSSSQDASSSGMLRARLSAPIGKPNRWLIISAMPDTPPGAIRLGSMKHQTPIACSSAPAKSPRISSPVSLHFF